ncbi:MAG: DUF445 domain-containing protein [Bacteroidota bacterium]|nr:DUF445 domain-containing protein [Bacteroidota bacterium]
MKRITLLAPVSLIAATLLFFATLPFEHHFGLGLLHAFAEAAMIGGLADWFAVVALFRHPFGLRIPHTAIIPKHRAKLTTGIIDMVQNRWLTKETILERIASWNMSSTLLSILSGDGSRAPVLRFLRSALTEILRDVDDDRFARGLLSLLRRQIQTDDLLRWLQVAGMKGMEGGWHRVLFTHAIGQAAGWLETPEIRRVIIGHLQHIAEEYADNPVRRLGKWVAESTNTLNYEDLATAIVGTLNDELRRMQSDDTHPARDDFERWLDTAMKELRENGALRSHVEAWREEMLDGEGTPELLRRPIARARSWALDDLGSEDSVIMQQIGSVLQRAEQRFAGNPESQRRLDSWIKEKIAELVERYHGEIGALVERNLARLDDAQLVRQIEEKVGGDLQYIRVNGAIVGGLVGALIYLFKHFVS